MAAGSSIAMKREGRTTSIPSRKTVNGRPLVVAVSPAMAIGHLWFVFSVFVCLCKLYCKLLVCFITFTVCLLWYEKDLCSDVGSCTRFITCTYKKAHCNFTALCQSSVGMQSETSGLWWCCFSRIIREQPLYRKDGEKNRVTRGTCSSSTTSQRKGSVYVISTVIWQFNCFTYIRERVEGGRKEAEGHIELFCSLWNWLRH